MLKAWGKQPLATSDNGVACPGLWVAARGFCSELKRRGIPSSSDVPGPLRRPGTQCLEGLLAIDSSVKVVIASGHSADGPTKEALAAGDKGVVDKPYDMRQLQEVVREVLDAGSGTQGRSSLRSTSLVKLLRSM